MGGCYLSSMPGFSTQKEKSQVQEDLVMDKELSAERSIYKKQRESANIDKNKNKVRVSGRTEPNVA